jgi:hypothetical protein
MSFVLLGAIVSDFRYTINEGCEALPAIEKNIEVIWGTMSEIEVGDLTPFAG